MRPGHNSQKCYSTNTCKKCNAKHNTLLHIDLPTSETKKTDDTASVHTIFRSGDSKRALLATALVNVTDAVGQIQSFRALLDPGADVSLASERCIQQLGLPRQKSDVQFSGFGASSMGKSRGLARLTLGSRFDADFCIDVDAYIVGKVTGPLPKLPCRPDEIAHLTNLKLADPGFSKPGSIDLLLGADVFFESLKSGQIKAGKGKPVAQETSWGWIVGGECASQNLMSASINHFRCEDANLDELLTKFWQLEELPSKPILTAEEKRCEEHFVATTTRDSEGRFIVEMPLKENHPPLGSSRDIAVKRLKQMERSLNFQPERKQQYVDFMNEYIIMGHMELVPPEDLCKPYEEVYYLPHHAVIKESSSTTKLRVVFDASSKTSSGYSLNDIQMPGPKLQDDLFVIVVRFRMYIIAFTADICKLFRMILMALQHRDLQRVVWRESPEKAILDYRLTTVTYGEASSPYLAKRCLQLLGELGRQDYPLASEAVSNDFYMDDLLSGSFSLEGALELQKQTLDLMQSAKMELRKWSSCSEPVLDSLEPKLREMETPFRIDENDVIKTLGLHWIPSSDVFWFKVTLPIERNVITKRTISSDTSKVSDVSRSVVGFCDASEVAIAAVVYLRSKDEKGDYVTRLVAAKTKVAPLKQVSLPRLELNGAVSLVRLMEVVASSFLAKPHSMHAFTDSTVVLAWIRDHPKRWDTYVANRVAKIHEVLHYEFWHHIPGVQNPADCASRGIRPLELVSHQLWWTGPKLLKEAEFHALVDESIPEEALNEQRRSAVVHHVITDTEMLYRFSSLMKLQRVTAYCIRFANNCRLPQNQRSTSYLSSAELQHALIIWVKIVQQNSFPTEIQSVNGVEGISVRSRLRNLNPFIDEAGILRVGGRLRHAKIPSSKKYPIIIPGQNVLTTLIINHEHYKQLHGGCQIVLASIQRRFWIVNGRDAVRRHIRKCLKCCRFRAETATQMMSDLPSVRVNPNPCFLKVGVDFAGPYTLRVLKGRGNYKGYVSIFVCMVTRAIHLELVTSLSSEAFIAALKRFVSRRRIPSDIYSDCGRNFVGANKELKQLWKSAAFNADVGNYLATESINRYFNPPGSPHFGGLWEAGLKSVKYHLVRVMGNITFNYEEMHTVLCQIEACLNSRPLTQLSSDPNDLEAITPGHFLNGDAPKAIPEQNLVDQPVSHQARFKLQQKVVQQFWKRWSSEFLTRLQQRPKWITKGDTLSVGDLVLVKDERLPPLKWKLARIISAHPGADGIARVFTVKTADGDMKRPLVKLCPLPIDTVK